MKFKKSIKLLIHYFFPYLRIDSNPAFSSFRNRVVESITFSKFVVIMLCFVSFVKIHVIIGKEMIMILWPYQIIWVCVFALIWVKKCGFVLTKLIVIIFIIEILVSLLCTFIDCWSELINHFLEPCFFCPLYYWFFRNRIHINIQSS